MSDEKQDALVEHDAPELPPKDTVAPGQWYWIREDSADVTSEKWLGCVTHVGTNYAGLTSARYRGTTRIHFDEFWKSCTRESRPFEYIEGQVAHATDTTRQLMAEVVELTRRLVVGSQPAANGAPDNALVLLSGAPNVEDYKRALIQAKKDELPALFEAIEKSNESVVAWMKARSIPLKAQIAGLKGISASIDAQIFNVELYAGLVETITTCHEGQAANATEPIHLMQRRHYMDEECLAHYETGGMTFRDVEHFDRWLARPKNLARILPFPRTIAAFRVRRDSKEIEFTGNMRDFFAMMEAEKYDKKTFLYIRNGDRLYRLSTGIEFEVKLFPDLDHHVLSGGKLYAERFGDSIRDNDNSLISEGDFEARCADHDKAKAEHEKKEAEYEALSKEERGSRSSPWFYDEDPRQRYEEFTPASVYYDDIAERVRADLHAHNRIVTIIQGLLDRSPALHPHPSWQLWTPEGFAQAIKLVYDSDRAITSGDKPDFEAFRARLNATLKRGSITVGQEDAWERFEALKEHNRLLARGRDYYGERCRPYGDPGPGTIAKVESFGRNGALTYTWLKPRRVYRSDGEKVKRTFKTKAARVLNIDAYTPGDYRQFFADPRTRAAYLQWAPLLLTAEEYHAGNWLLGESKRKDGNKKK